METLGKMTITKQFRSPSPVELERLGKRIDEMLEDALAELKDPDAHAVRQMINKMKKPPHPLNLKTFDTQPWDGKTF